MIKPKRLPSEKPYPSRVWLMRPFKTVLIFGGMFAGLMWLVGGLIDNLLPDMVTLAAAVACVGLFAVYITIATVSTHRQERFAQRHMDMRKRKMAEFEAMGFVASRKFIGSSRIFAVDEKMRKWYLIDYFNSPDKARLHDLSAITQALPAQNADWLPRGHVALLSNGKMLSKKDNDLYFFKTGVLLWLNDPECPTALINCFKTENDVELILAYLAPLLEESKTEHVG